MIVLVMGVSGSGKTTIGTLLAERLQTGFADADAYHSAANMAKMAAGNALNDEDRQPWLESLNALLRTWLKCGDGGVLACSALKEIYRKKLIRGLPDDSVVFVLLDGSRRLIAERLAERNGHYMNPSLLDSQFATLERPADALRIMNDQTPDDIVDEIMKYVKV